MLIAWVATIYGLWQLIELHEIKGKRFNRYHELGQYALGENLHCKNSCYVIASSQAGPINYIHNC